MLNKAQVIGNLGKDPEVRVTPQGDNVCSLSVATTEKWKDKQTGQQKEVTEWHRVIVWGKAAEHCGTYLEKGSKVYCEGKLRTRKWQDQQQVERYTTEIVVSGPGSTIKFLSSNPDARNSRTAQQPTHQPAQQQAPAQDDWDDDIPF